VRSGFAAVGRVIGNPAFGDLCFDYFLQGVRGNTFDLAREKLGITNDIGELVEIYRNHWPDIQLCHDARLFLESCRLRLGVITDGPIASQRAKMQALGLLTWIDLPLFTTEIRAPKPSEIPFKLAAMALDSPFERCVYIADNPHKDFIGAHNLGMHTIRIRRPDALHYNAQSGDDVDLELMDFTGLLNE
jgi:putative hydrolase of the HAD superfamily